MNLPRTRRPILACAVLANAGKRKKIAQARISVLQDCFVVLNGMHRHLLRGRDAEMKPGTLSHGALDPDAAAVSIDNMASDGESESGAACFARARGVHAVKSLEDAFEVVFRNSNS